MKVQTTIIKVMKASQLKHLGWCELDLLLKKFFLLEKIITTLELS